MNKLTINPEYIGYVSILIDNSVLNDGTILYVNNGIICAVNPPTDSTNKVLCITENIPSWQIIPRGTIGIDILNTLIYELSDYEWNASLLQQNVSQMSGGLTDGMNYDIVLDYPVLSSVLTAVNTFVSSLIINSSLPSTYSAKI